MTLNEIKKALYKDKPLAYLTENRVDTSGEKLHGYTAILNNNRQVYFYIPESEHTDQFDEGMQAQLLIRWLV